MITVSNITKSFTRNSGKFSAINNVSLHVNSGEIIALTGHSGSGKTTLLNIIAGLLNADQGKIIIGNVDFTALSEKDKIRFRNEKIGYALQGDSLLPNFKIIDNICMPSYLSENPADCSERASMLLNMVGLSDLAEEYPANLSGGEMRRAAIARAFINDPVLVLADEPTSNLDPDNAHVIMKMLRDLSSNGAAVIFSTHEMEYLNYADRQIVLDHGSITQPTK